MTKKRYYDYSTSESEEKREEFLSKYYPEDEKTYTEGSEIQENFLERRKQIKNENSKEEEKSKEEEIKKSQKIDESDIQNVDNLENIDNIQNLDNIENTERKIIPKSTKLKNVVFFILKNEFFLPFLLSTLSFLISLIIEEKKHTFYLPTEPSSDMQINLELNKKPHKTFYLKETLRNLSIFIILSKFLQFFFRILSLLIISRVSYFTRYFEYENVDENAFLSFLLTTFSYLNFACGSISIFICLAFIIWKNKNDKINELILIKQMTIGEFSSTCLVICGIIVIKNIIIGKLKREYNKERGVKEKVAQHVFIRNLLDFKKENMSYCYFNKISENNKNEPNVYCNYEEDVDLNILDINRKSFYGYIFNGKAKKSRYTDKNKDGYFVGEVQRHTDGETIGVGRYLKGKGFRNVFESTYSSFESNKKKNKNDKKDKNYIKSEDEEEIVDKELSKKEREKAFLRYKKKYEKINRNVLEEEQSSKEDDSYSESMDNEVSDEKELDKDEKNIINVNESDIEEINPYNSSDAEKIQNSNNNSNLEKNVKNNKKPNLKKQRRESLLFSEDIKADIKEDLNYDITDLQETKDVTDFETNEEKEENYSRNFLYFRTLKNKYRTRTFFKKFEKVNPSNFPLIHQLRILMNEKLAEDLKVDSQTLTFYETTLLNNEFSLIYKNFYKKLQNHFKKEEFLNKKVERIKKLMDKNYCNTFEDLIALKTGYLIGGGKCHIHNRTKPEDIANDTNNEADKNTCFTCIVRTRRITNSPNNLDLYCLFSWWENEFGNTKKEDIKVCLNEFIIKYGNIMQNKNDMTAAIRHLDSILYLLIGIFFFAVLFWKLFVNVQGVFTEIMTGILGSSFIIAGTTRSAIECLIFLFCVHPYDVGDRILIDLKSHGNTSVSKEEGLHDGMENLVVKKLNIFSTIFEKFDGTELIVNNNLLMNKFILNVMRSDHLLEIHRIVVTSTTKVRKLDRLKSEIEGFLKSNDGFTDFLMFNYEKIDTNKMYLKIFIDYKENIQEYLTYLNLRNKFLVFLNNKINEFGIRYEENKQGIKIYRH